MEREFGSECSMKIVRKKSMHRIFVLQGFIMLTSIKGYYEKGKIIMQEDAPVQSKTDVIITFLTPDTKTTQGKRIPGGLKGKVSLHDDFNEPLNQ
jgi:hypothetical protein